jgi:N-acetyl-1-D-myo-inositol-2-amino-2-deoxy-alpha-D-glucopyranoside deacetylase
VLTYDEVGGYGHPDHIQAHRITMRAIELADQWEVPKVYWNAIPKSLIAQGIEEMKKIGSDFFGAESADDIPFAKDDALVTAVVDATEYVDQKMAAMKAHETQIAIDGPFFALSNNLGTAIWGQEFYSLVKGIPAAPFDKDGRETDLFAGIVP